MSVTRRKLICSSALSLWSNISTWHYSAAIPVLGQDSIFKLFNTIDPLGIRFSRHVFVCVSSSALWISALFRRMTIIWLLKPNFTLKTLKSNKTNLAAKITASTLPRHIFYRKAILLFCFLSALFWRPRGVWWISWAMPNQLQMKWTIATEWAGWHSVGGEVTTRIDTSNWHCECQNQHNHTHTALEKQRKEKAFRRRWFDAPFPRFDCSFYAFGLENKLPRLFVPTNPLIAVLGLLYAHPTRWKKYYLLQISNYYLVK